MTKDGLGGFFPASSFIDMGLVEHSGHAHAPQRAPVKDRLPSCSGCLCSVAAINSAGLTGQSSEAPNHLQIFEAIENDIKMVKMMKMHLKMQSSLQPSWNSSGAGGVGSWP